MVRIRTYPVAGIDDGIKACIENAKRLLEFAFKLESEGSKELSILIYTFALEEFGKAVLLRRNKASTTVMIRDDVTFTSHEKKLEAAITELKNSWISIPVYEEPEVTSEIMWKDGKIVSVGTLKFSELKKIGSFAQVENRLNMLFVDYDEANSKWKTWKDTKLPIGFVLKNTLRAFQHGLDEWAITNGYQSAEND